ncbi:MAG: methyltransferase regulatory domain-containing protein [Candidatus Riflebacteria bacterium]|nr:methyltransferase regulatory domain-containing protein [Candidatus Riflebacteria bacterium]
MSQSARWTEGYVSEVDYTHGFYREMGPTFLRFALTLASRDSPDPSAPFTFCELGFGHGVTLNVLAAACPHGEFWGTDFNPAHAAGARALARSAGLANVHIHEDSFAEFLDRQTPEFDYVCLHGVYSWVSTENHKRILEIVRRKLRPGGLVYVSYNCLPGWAVGLPLRHLLASHVEAASGPIMQRLESAKESVRKLHQVKAQFFTTNPPANRLLDDLLGRPPKYLVHEYLNRDFHANYFSEVAAEFAEAKLTYAGTATLVDLVDPLNFSEETAALVAPIQDPVLQETVRDFLVNKQFRRDGFVKGPRSLTEAERSERLRSLRFGLKVPRLDAPRRVRCARGEVALQEDVYGPLLDRMAQGPASLDELMRSPELAKLGLPRLLQALAILVGIGSAEPAHPSEIAATAAAPVGRLNDVLVDRAERIDEISVLVSPVLGTAVKAGRIDQLLLRALQAGDPLSSSVWQVLSSKGQRLAREGKRIESEEENLALLEKLAIAFRDTLLPVWQKLGVARG